MQITHESLIGIGATPDGNNKGCYILRCSLGTRLYIDINSKHFKTLQDVVDAAMKRSFEKGYSNGQKDKAYEIRSVLGINED